MPGTDSLKNPSEPVCTAFRVPFAATVTPANPEPSFESVTLPVIKVCADEVKAIKLKIIKTDSSFETFLILFLIINRNLELKECVFFTQSMFFYQINMYC